MIITINNLTFMELLLFLMGMLSFTTAYTTTSDCYNCLIASNPTSKYCISHEDASSGYCCSTASTHFCGNNKRYLCSDIVQTPSMKLFLCPYQ